MLHYQNITAAEEELDQVNQGLGFSVADTSLPVPVVRGVRNAGRAGLE